MGDQIHWGAADRPLKLRYPIAQFHPGFLILDKWDPY